MVEECLCSQEPVEKQALGKLCQADEVIPRKDSESIVLIIGHGIGKNQCVPDRNSPFWCKLRDEFRGHVIDVASAKRTRPFCRLFYDALQVRRVNKSEFQIGHAASFSGERIKSEFKACLGVLEFFPGIEKMNVLR